MPSNEPSSRHEPNDRTRRRRPGGAPRRLRPRRARPRRGRGGRALPRATPAAAAEVQQLRTAAAWIGATEALAPPVQLRASIIESARSSSGPIPVDEPLTAYLTEAARLDELAGEIPGSAFGRTTANGLGVHELVIHLAAMESLLAATLGEPTEAGIDETDIERRTARFVERYRARPIDDAPRACVARSRWWVGGRRIPTTRPRTSPASAWCSAATTCCSCGPSRPGPMPTTSGECSIVLRTLPRPGSCTGWPTSR